MHRIAVIGRGLIGSAAARHLAETTDGIACIGPDEPPARADHTGVFASHYDEGRMTRFVDPTLEWALTARASIQRYRDIEARSGISFYDPVGYLGLGRPGSTYNDRCAAMGASLGAELERLDADGMRARFPFLAVDDDADGLVEAGGAGHISPRKLVQAQTRLAEAAGATMIRQAARAIRPGPDTVEVELWNGSTVTAEKVLVATGAFTTACGLSPSDLDLTVFGRTTVLVRIEGEATEALRGMPTMLDSKTGAYILPPIRYPDGHLYLKIGVGTPADPRFSELGGLQSWFKGTGDERDRQNFTARLKALFPVLQGCAHWHTDTCATTYTASGLPLVDFAGHPRVALAVGGCGKGAKGSDEWGRIGAMLISGAEWTSEVPRESLAIHTKRVADAPKARQSA